MRSSRAATRVTDLARMQSLRNEQLVLAESALIGERRVAVTRIVMALLFAFSNELVPLIFGGYEAGGPSMVVGLSYLLFAVITLVKVWRAKPSPVLSLWIPLALTVVDFAVISAFAALDFRQRGYVSPEMGAIAFALLVTFAVSRLRVLHVVVSTGFACTCYGFLSLRFGVVDHRPLFFVLTGFLALGFLMSVTNVAVRRMFRDLRRRDELTRFLPSEVAERVIAGGGEALRPVQREVTILFSDIRGFTALSESKSPAEVFGFLDRYFGTMVNIVKQHDGVVNKFLGDGLLAFWGAPNEDKAHAANAIRAALDMRNGLDAFNAELLAEGQAPISIGIGIHSGFVTAGLLGSGGQSEYTVIGDVVNVASRIESLTKTLEVDLLVSEATFMQAGDGIQGTRLAAEPIRGRQEPVVLYAVGAALSNAIGRLPDYDHTSREKGPTNASKDS